MSSDGKVLTKDGVQYKVGDHVYLHPHTFDQMEQAETAEVPDYAAKGRFHKVGTMLNPAPWLFVDQMLWAVTYIVVPYTILPKLLCMSYAIRHCASSSLDPDTPTTPMFIN